ncbi:hypothetical protein BDZ90DRAFT_28440 [Jaminaea rosea]|uniref:Uncharacterized protein n=1 Tax=Jaminaea rosea TaxID=1569628 RepID=A0A316V320_9BASI|nr:hypothetical protein BDZ90DRAFT_28440 [Jaminaea rosea]PWN30931.1 hypothetical protein BDZ90DRAFT_28440 [Jaminaea rosea]
MSAATVVAKAATVLRAASVEATVLRVATAVSLSSAPAVTVASLSLAASRAATVPLTAVSRATALNSPVATVRATDSRASVASSPASAVLSRVTEVLPPRAVTEGEYRAEIQVARFVTACVQGRRAMRGSLGRSWQCRRRVSQQPAVHPQRLHHTWREGMVHIHTSSESTLVVSETCSVLHPCSLSPASARLVLGLSWPPSLPPPLRSMERDSPDSYNYWD